MWVTCGCVGHVPTFSTTTSEKLPPAACFSGFRAFCLTSYCGNTVTSPKRLNFVWQSEPDDDSEELFLQALAMLLPRHRSSSTLTPLDESPSAVNKECA